MHNVGLHTERIPKAESVYALHLVYPAAIMHALYVQSTKRTILQNKNILLRAPVAKVCSAYTTFVHKHSAS